MQTVATPTRGPAGNSVPSCQPWQTLVLMEAPQRHVAPHSATVTYARFDAAHKSLPAPWLLAQWSEDFGWYRSLADSPLLTQPQTLAAANGIAHAVEVRVTELGGNSTAESRATMESRTPVESGTQVGESAARLHEMLAEAAHDIRSPIAVAQQILSTLAGRIQRSGQGLSDESQLLQEANVRLTQANRWAEGILVEQGLQHGLPVNIRRRFYPQQWLAEIQPLLQSLASQRQVRLTWQGWDRSLPRLYVDPNLLSRAVLNLVSNAIAASSPNQEVRVRAAWQHDAVPRFLVRVEDDGSGLSLSLKRRLNSRATWPAGEAGDGEHGIGLRTVKALVRALGGNLYAENGSAGGTRIGLSLPIDQQPALLRSWLLQWASLSGTAPQPTQRLVIHAVRSLTRDSLHDDASLQIDNRLQQSAGSNDFVYRVAADRWLWLGLVPQSSTAAAPQALLAALKLLSQLSTASGVPYDCRQQPVFQLDGLRPSRWLDSTAGASRPASTGPSSLSYVVELVASKMSELTAHHLPPLDELAGRERAMVFQSTSGGHERVIRSDQAHASSTSSPMQLAPKTKPLQTAQLQPGQPLQPALPAQAPSSVRSMASLAEMPCDMFSGALAELTQQWHAAHGLLARSHGRLAPVE